MKKIFCFLRRIASKPPRYILSRVSGEILAELGRVVAPVRSFLVFIGFRNTNLISLLVSLPSLGVIRSSFIWLPSYQEVKSRGAADDSQLRIISTAELAMQLGIELLGSGRVKLRLPRDWHRDIKTDKQWRERYFRSIRYGRRSDRCDVKIPWEISRLQWMIPVGQAYVLTGDERYAEFSKSIFLDWIDANPYARSVNWACTMEAAMRIFTWAWFFHVFKDSLAWADQDFRSRFLAMLYLHGDFTERYIERSDINGNHYTADAAALVVVGLFFGKGKTPERWLRDGWTILCEELPRQVYADGVDFEASVPYHRLVLELFFIPALFREKAGLDVPAWYRDRIIAMARFVAAYSRPDGSVPLWGDADDARVLPFGEQDINDHRYLLGLIGAHWDVPDLKVHFAGPKSEIWWLLGPEAAASLPDQKVPATPLGSHGFSEGGFYVMRNAVDHVFIDCGPIGLGGRGGHGHNDCLSFEAVLDGAHLVSDCGAYLYTSSYDERNAFRSTAYHNTPQIDGEEINRFISPDYLWNMHYDAKPDMRQWLTGQEQDVFIGSHAGYRRLPNPVSVQRKMVLHHQHHMLQILDVFEGNGMHRIDVPLHLAIGVEVIEEHPQSLVLSSQGSLFRLLWGGVTDWKLEICGGRVSPSYGVAKNSKRLNWHRQGLVTSHLSICLVPEAVYVSGPMLNWANFLAGQPL